MNIIEKIKGIVSKIRKKAPKAIAAGATIATVGLATGCGTEKDAKNIDNNIKVEQEKNFKELYKYDVSIKEEVNETEQEVNELKSENEVLQFLKNMYVEEYEKITGDTSLTTEDLKMYYKSYQNYVYVNEETGEMFTHGNTPAITEQRLKEDGISYVIQYDVGIYRVENKDGKMIDCVTLQSENGESVSNKVIVGDQYDNKSYTSIMEKMGTTIPYGLNYAEYLGKGNENDIAISKAKFIKSLEKLENMKKSQEQIEEIESGFEHE